MLYLDARPRGRQAFRLALALFALASVLTVPAVPQMRARVAGNGNVTAASSVASQLERDMLVMLNRERTSRGLSPLVMDNELVQLARAHSRDMLARRYFSHNTPDGKDPFDRFKAAGIAFWAAGENLALAPSLDIAHNGLMRSREHRDNILHPAFGRVGIGIIKDRRGLMISQEFKD